MVSMRQVSVTTSNAPQFVDITEAAQREVEASGVREGVALLRSRHTTAALTCTEGDPTIHEDCLELLREQMLLSRRYRSGWTANSVPELSRNDLASVERARKRVIKWRYPRVGASLIADSVTICFLIIQRSALCLHEWRAERRLRIMCCKNGSFAAPAQVTEFWRCSRCAGQPRHAV